MAERITKTQRWLDLIGFLLGRRLPVEVGELMMRLPAYAEKWRTGDSTDQASARRMFERDKDELRAMGVPLETVPYTINYGTQTLEGYQISRKDFYLPYLTILEEHGEGTASGLAGRADSQVSLSPAEAVDAVTALRRAASMSSFPFADEATSALRKLSFDLDLEAFGNPSVHVAERPGTSEMLATLRVLSDALLSRKMVGFTYAGAYRGEVTQRQVAPYGLFFQRDWYLVGRDQDRGAIRLFRVARAQDVQVNSSRPKEPDFEVPDDFILTDYLSRDAWEMGGEEEKEVLVRFTPAAAALAERNGRGKLVEMMDCGSSVRSFRIERAEPFLRWVLSHAGDAKVVAPPELAEQLRSTAEAVFTIYAGDVANG